MAINNKLIFSLISKLLVSLYLCIFSNLAFAESSKFIFQCKKLNEPSMLASLIIDLDLKKIELDSFEKRKKWEEFNEFLSKRNLKNASYQADQYIITNITNDEVLGIKSFLSRGNIKINRNSLMVYVEEYFEDKFNEMSYICNISKKGF